MQNNALVTWTVIAMILWTGISWYWYACGIKGFCGNTEVVQTENAQDVADREDEFVPENRDESERRVVTETVTEKVTIECPSYIKTFIRFGQNNNSADVMRLERYLNTYENADLEEDGFYGRKDFEAVQAFQEKYRSAVLDPIGLNSPSGIVGTFTVRQINALNCAYEYNKNN